MRICRPSTYWRPVIVFLLCVAACHGQSDMGSNGKVNGRFWNLFEDKPSKMAFVIGAQAMTGVLARKDYEVYFGKLKVGDIVDGVDKFYSQTQNLSISVVGAFTVVALRALATPGDIDQEKLILSIIAAMRETAATYTSAPVQPVPK